MNTLVRYNGNAPGGAGNTTRRLTRSLDCAKEGLMPNGTCSVTVCDLPVHGQDLCAAHYARMLTNGTPGDTPVRHVLQDTETRIKARVTVDPETGCWVWQGFVNRGGYGTLCVNGRKQLVHRAIFEATVGPIPDGMPLDHVCLTRACCNPEHLRVVSSRESSQRVRGHASSTSRYRGVSWAPESGNVWRAQFSHQGRSAWLGGFKDEWDAATAAHEARLAAGVFGEDEYWAGVLADREAE